MIRFLWIGNLESEEEFKNKVKKGYSLASAQVSQNNILSGIEEVTGLVFDSINGSVVQPYPQYKDKYIKQVVWKHKDGAFDVSVGYKNQKYINRIKCKNSMIKEARKWVKERYKGEELTVITYSMRSSVMATACEIKKLIPHAKIYLIITDLPQYMDLGQSKVKALLKKIDGIRIKQLQSKFDGFVLYASKMAKVLKIPDTKWILMEGLYDPKECEIRNIVNSQKKAIMYSGKLEYKYGIKLLLDAFMQIEDSDVELWLTGGGNAEGYIKECSMKDKRIIFFGFLASREEVLKKQLEASLLINMRLPSEIASAYCFPSKLLEYMVTGIPTMTFKLEGIPDEYYKYLLTIETESITDIQQSITNALLLPETDKNELGLNAKEFIMKNKLIKNQCEKIYSFVGDNNDENIMGMQCPNP